MQDTFLIVYKEGQLACIGVSLTPVKFPNHRYKSATVAYWVAHSPNNTEEVGSIPGTGRYIVARMTT